MNRAAHSALHSVFLDSATHIVLQGPCAAWCTTLCIKASLDPSVWNTFPCTNVYTMSDTGWRIELCIEVHTVSRMLPCATNCTALCDGTKRHTGLRTISCSSMHTRPCTGLRKRSCTTLYIVASAHTQGCALSGAHSPAQTPRHGRTQCLCAALCIALEMQFTVWCTRLWEFKAAHGPMGIFVLHIVRTCLKI